MVMVPGKGQELGTVPEPVPEKELARVRVTGKELVPHMRQLQS